MIRAALGGLLVVFIAGIGWVSMTESGLQAAVSVAQALTGQRLQVKGVTGRLTSTIGFDELDYSDPSATVHLRDVRLDLRLSRLLVSRVQASVLQVAELTITLHETPAPENREPINVRLPIRVAVEDGRIGRFDLKRDDGTRIWQARDIELAARWRDEWIVLGGISATTEEAGEVSARGRLALVDDVLRFVGVRASGPGSVRIDGDLALGDGAQNDLDVSWTGLRWPGLEGVASDRGRAHLQGEWGNYGWNLDLKLAAAEMTGAVVARGRGSLDNLLVHRLQVLALDGEVTGSGRVQWDGGPQASAKLRFEGLNPGLRIPEWSGVVNGTAQFTGDWRAGDPELSFDATLHDSQLRGYPLQLSVRGDTQKRRLVLHQLHATSGVSTLDAKGRLLPDFDVSGKFRSDDLESLWAGLSGSANLDISLTGSHQAPRLKVGGTGKGLVYRSGENAYRATAAKLSANLSLEGRSEFRAELDDADLGATLSRLVLEGNGTVRRHRLRVDVEAPTGTLDLSVAGGYARGHWTGELNRLRLEPRDESAWELESSAGLGYAAGDWNLSRLCLENPAGRVCAEGSGDRSGNQLAIEVGDVQLAGLKNWLPPEWSLSGGVDGTASVQWNDDGLRDVRADLVGSAGSLEGVGVQLEFGKGSLKVEPDGNRLRAQVRLTPAGGTIEGDVWLAPGTLLLDRSLAGQLRASLPDLSWLPVLSAEIAGASGSLDSQLTLGGTLRSPTLQGSLSVADARVQLATPGTELTNITAEFETTARLPLSVSMEANAGGGFLRLQGGLESLSPRLKGQFRLTGDNAKLVNTPEAKAWVTPDLELQLSGPDSRLTGEIHVPRASITPREISSGGVAPSADQVIVDSGSASARATQLESRVKIVLGDRVEFDGLGLKTRLEGTIEAHDQPGRPTRGFGELRLVGGRYKAYGQDLTIETGRLLFNGGLLTEPGIELTAYRQPQEDLRVGLRVRGPLATPTFSLYSDPAGLSREQQLSWLVLGRPLSETLQSGQRTELDSAAASLGFAGGEYLAQQLAPRIGLDEVSVGTQAGQTNEQARLTIGKYLSPKLFVSYGFGLFEPGRFFKLQYDLGAGFKLSGESGVEQVGNIIYTIER